VIDAYDAVLRHPPAAGALVPDLVLRVGGLPTSKPLLGWLAAHDAPQIVVSDAGWPDPSLAAHDVVHANPRLLCEALHPSLGTPDRDDGWLATWRRADAAARRALAAHSAALEEPFEGRALAEVAALLPDGATLVVSSSMPVRDLDAFAGGDARRIRVLANRGANGIDGVVSTALGAAATREAGDGPLVLVIGDLAFYHDMNGLLAAKLHALDATIVVLNNDGGGIFSFLPQAAHPAHFEQLFGTPHGLTFAPAAAMYDARYTAASTWSALREAVRAGLDGRGLHIVEMSSDRARNVTLHREAWAAVAAALDALGVAHGSRP
jgi:2-succinyl-5-enolpyruvyl-6-hydroxy-3-cyclohexene-1-carboxylate synthase